MLALASVDQPIHTFVLSVELAPRFISEYFGKSMPSYTYKLPSDPPLYVYTSVVPSFL